MSLRIRIGTRPSKLALKQVEEIKYRLSRVNFDIVAIETRGDKDKIRPLTLEEDSDFFTHELEQALIKGRIDVAIHSAKDLEKNSPEELAVIAMTSSISPFDCLVSSNGLDLDKLVAASRIGTSSSNRRQSILKYRKDLITKDIRGNVDQRLEQLDQGCFEAIIVAHAALIRLELCERIAEIIPFDVIKPHPLQGRLAIQVRQERRDLFNIFKDIHGN